MIYQHNLFPAIKVLAAGGAFESTGTATSPVFDFSDTVNWSGLFFNLKGGSTPADSSISMQIATSDDGKTFTSFGDVLTASDSRFCQIRVILNSSTGQLDTPVVNDVRIEAEGNNGSIPSMADMPGYVDDLYIISRFYN